jgi:hypothetical protein
MDTKQRMDHLEVNFAGLFDRLAGVTHVTNYLIDHLLNPEQKGALVERLANRASETDASGRVYFAQLGGTVSDQSRFFGMPAIGRLPPVYFLFRTTAYSIKADLLTSPIHYIPDALLAVSKLVKPKYRIK